MGQVQKDFDKVKAFVDKCIEDLENGNYAYVCKGYMGGNDGDKYDNTIQSYAHKIIDKLTSLGYKYTTDHGHGCYDWKFYKEIEL